LLLLHNLLNLPQEPAVDLREFEHLLHIPALGEGWPRKKMRSAFGTVSLVVRRLVID
jgi:hypothetical protein